MMMVVLKSLVWRVVAMGTALAFGSTALLADCRDRPNPGVVWSKCDKSRKILSGVDLTDAKLDWVNLTSADMSGATLRGALLFRANTTRTSLRDADLRDANLTKVQGLRTIFSGINAANANFTISELNRSNFDGADLTGANFTKSELSRVILTNAKIDKVNFHYANVSRANFRDSSLSGTNFHGAYTFLMRVEGVDLTATTGLTQDQLDIACGDDTTKLPEGLKRPPDWPCIDAP